VLIEKNVKNKYNGFSHVKKTRSNNSSFTDLTYYKIFYCSYLNWANAKTGVKEKSAGKEGLIGIEVTENNNSCAAIFPSRF
jgi:hypothetical protein